MNVKLLNPLTLAYMGDAVLDQYVRKYIVLKLQSKPNRLHQVSKQYVSAKSQAQTLEYLMTVNWFTDEELDILRRGRNAKSYTKAKNIDIQTYRKSSALEAVIGFLYLDHRLERLEALLQSIVEIVNER
ncbi:Mini-ribonuclease 3 [Staphylococcus saccharolyticus]|uniref:Mini-ribonuclease 3 n=1 Tax=Staphylococcus saccharolyticus TaxID=33028 RepID=A0A380HC42_9STAP|nr:Mini-ribonuclease 3 [Staphylococcus saccharolyticus]MBL7565897.1 Mini-ribonuclease 3 [Staphylococcus saccharolyticus]MBL7572021.1 Mini-ribonuclease 3 [Staphylococcus saccharolyticus]QQB99251.1 Mini-ribonuclease 3 [Staphylococcus saccharolyticus]QRJ66558.1 Mini-ribonuclease 3 [Staphylococcus saccharolyticus]RTY00355.1 ribonuclease III [Staphylococcus saccharolyticus]